MTRFEHAGPDVVHSPPVHAAAKADSLPARHNRIRGIRRARALLGAGAAVAVLAVLVLGGLVAPGSDRAGPVMTRQPQPPAAGIAAARALLGAVEPGYTVTGPAEWVRTTRRAYERLAGYRGAGPNEEVYVVQVRGQFTLCGVLAPAGREGADGLRCQHRVPGPRPGRDQRQRRSSSWP